MTQKLTEAELLELAQKYSFRSRIDSNSVSGPIMVWGRGSVVRDVNGYGVKKVYFGFLKDRQMASIRLGLHGIRMGK